MGTSPKYKRDIQQVTNDLIFLKKNQGIKRREDIDEVILTLALTESTKARVVGGLDSQNMEQLISY